MSTQSSVRLAAASAIFVLALACGKSNEAATTAAQAHECTVTVAKKVDGEPETFKGSAQGPDEKAAEEQAWADACGQIPEAERESCRDSEKFTWSASGMAVETDGKKEYSKNITLTRVVTPEEFEGKGQSSESSDKACELALANACKAAGADGDCVAAGTHDKRGVMTSSTRTKAK